MRHRDAEDRSSQREAAGPDLHLTVELERLAGVPLQGQAGPAQRLQPTLDDVGLAGIPRPGGEPRRRTLGAHAALAVEDHDPGAVKVRLVEAGQGRMAGAGHPLAGVLVGLAHVDQGRPLRNQPLGVFSGNRRQ